MTSAIGRTSIGYREADAVGPSTPLDGMMFSLLLRFDLCMRRSQPEKKVAIVCGQRAHSVQHRV